LKNLTNVNGSNSQRHASRKRTTGRSGEGRGGRVLERTVTLYDSLRAEE